MKILLLTSFFPPTHTAGTEKRTFGYAKTLLERGHAVQVLCAGKWESGEQYWNGARDEANHPYIASMFGIPSIDILFGILSADVPFFKDIYQEVSAMLRQMA